MSRVTALLLALLLLSAPTIALAAPPEAARAESLFNNGKEAMAKGDLATACANLAESHKLDPAVGTLLNLATCEERSGKVVAALEHFNAALAQLPKEDFRIPFAKERVEKLGPRVVRIVPRFKTPPPAGTRLLCDGEPAPLDGTIAVDPGPHAIAIEVPGRPSQRVDLTTEAGEERVLSLEVAAGPAPSPPPEAAGPPRALAWIAAGIGFAGLATGTVTGILALDAAGTYRDHCVNGICDGDGLSAAERGRTVSIVSPVAFGVGVVAAAVAVYLFLSTPPLKGRDRAWR